MRGIGLSKTAYGDMDLVDVVNFDTDDIKLREGYAFSKNEEGKISGTGILVCYSGDLSDILEKYHLKPIDTRIMDGVLNRFVLSNGVAAIKLTNIIRYEDIVNSNYANAFNNGLDLVHIRKNFDKLANRELFYNTMLPKEAYASLKSLFHGGVMNARQGVYENVKSADLVSAHASNIVNEIYPTGKYEKVRKCMTLYGLKELRKSYDIFYIAKVTFKNIRLKEGYIGIIYTRNNASLKSNNMTETHDGYLVKSDSITIAVTELYMECIDMCYEYDSAIGTSMYICSEADTLPDNIRQHVLNKFEDKQTQPKGTKEYEEAKLLVNMCYGFLCRNTDNYDSYRVERVFPYQWGVMTCLYTTYKIVKAMDEVIKKGGKVVCIATDSIKYIGDFDLEWGNGLGELKYEGTYDEAHIATAYRAVYKKGDELDIKLAGCLKDKAVEFFSKHPADYIFQRKKILQGRVDYVYNSETSRIEPVFYDYTLGRRKPFKHLEE